MIQMLPAGDAEKDVTGRRWEQRKELMRDVIIYMRNNPSILFYESGNESISREHMVEMIAIRDQYDPYGGRAIGSREMLDIREAEYGGEMLYVNKSEHHPMIQTEYCRDEGLRKYWDEYSYPFHKQEMVLCTKDRMPEHIIRIRTGWLWSLSDVGMICGVSVPEQAGVSIQEVRRLCFPIRRLMDVVPRIIAGAVWWIR